MLETLIKTFTEFIEWQEYDLLPITIGAALANFGSGDPVYLFLVGPPASGKTELIRSFVDCKGFYALSKLTPHTFVSGYIQHGKTVHKDKSLLIRLQNEGRRNVMIKDFTSILSERIENRNEIFGQLREIADGYYSQAFGTGEEVSWKGKLGFIAGVTGAIDESFSMRQTLGERFLQVRIREFDYGKAAEKAARWTGGEDAWRENMRKIMSQFIGSMDVKKLAEITLAEEVNEKLFNAAHLLSLARTGVKRDRFFKTLLTFPEPEGPARLMRQLIHLGKGIALCFNKLTVDNAVYALLRRVARDTIPLIRERCLYRIWRDELQTGMSEQTTVALSESLGQQKGTIRLWLEDLKDVGLLAKSYKDDSTLWSLSPKGFMLIQASEIFWEPEEKEEIIEECYDYEEVF